MQSAALTVLGADDAGEAGLIYTWATTGTPPAAVSFSLNGSNTAKNTTVSFTKAGSYTLQVTIRDAGSLSSTSSVTVQVNQTPSAISVTPTPAYVPAGSQQTYVALVRDQFGTSIPTPPPIAWSLASGGSIAAGNPTTSAVFTAQSSVGGPFTITATLGSLTAAATAYVVANATPTISSIATAASNPVTGISTTLTVLGADDGGESNLIYTWATTGTPPAPVTFSVNGTNAAKSTVATFTALGGYSLQVMVRDSAGLSTTQSLAVSVAAKTTSIAVTPASPTLVSGTTRQFIASARDQFGATMAIQPEVSWSITGGGSISDFAPTKGLMTVSAVAPGAFVVYASANFVVGSTPISVLPDNPGPTIATAASAASNPVTGASVGLSVLGADTAGEASLTYSWATTGTPPAAVIFSTNNSNAAKATTATFTKPGSYSFLVTIRDASQQTATSPLTVVVNDTVTAITVSPTNQTVAAAGTRQFTAVASNQFGTTIAPAPAFTWSVTGGGTVSATGLFTAGSTAGGPHTLQAVNTGVTGSTAVSVSVGSTTPTIATVAAATPSPATGTSTALSVLGADAGGEANLVYTWSTTGTPPAPVTFSVNGTNAAKNVTATFTKAGSYSLQCSVRNASYRTATSSIIVTVNATPTTIVVTPTPATVPTSSKATFTASSRDQFGNPVGTQPSFTWSVTGGGAVLANSPNTTAVFTASATAGGPFSVRAVNGALTGQASVTLVANAAPSISLASVAATPVTTKTVACTAVASDDGGEANLTYTWSQVSGPGTTTFSPNGTNAGKASTATFTATGAYQFRCEARDSGSLTSAITIPVTVVSGVTTLECSFNSSFSTSSVYVNRWATLSASAKDQFGLYMSIFGSNEYQWSVNGGGTISFETSDYATLQASSTPGGPYTATVRHLPTGKTTTKTFTVLASPPPIFVQPLSARQNPVTGQEVVLGCRVIYTDGYESGAMTYSVVGQSPAGVVFSEQKSSNFGFSDQSSSVRATFSKAGTYTFAATFTDPSGTQVASYLPVIVQQIHTTTTISPDKLTMTAGQVSTLTASAKDQFGASLSSQPSFTWSSTGGGTVVANSPNVSATYTAGTSAGGPFLVTARAATGTATASATISQTGNTAPTIATVTSANPNTVIGTTCTLSVLGADNGGEGGLRYLWSTVGTPPAPVGFSMNDVNAAKTVTATFARAGTYDLQCSIVDGFGLSITSTVLVVVQQTPTSDLRVIPPSAQIRIGSGVAYSLVGKDQFAQVMTGITGVTWSATGGGTITTTGMYTATGNGAFTVRGSLGSLSSPTVPVRIVTGNVTAVSTPFNLNVTASPITGTSDTRYNSALVSWSFNGPNSPSPLYQFRVLRDDYPITLSGATGFSSTSGFGRDVQALSPGRTYAYRVMGIDPDGSVSPLSSAFNYTTPTETRLPAPPTGLAAFDRTHTTISLSWEPATDFDGTGVVWYEVHRNGTHITTIKSLSWIDSGLTPSSTYVYTVRARDAANNYSAFATTGPLGTELNQTPPPPPTNLIVSGQSETSVTVNWTAPNSPVASYLISIGGTNVLSVAGTTATITGLIPGTGYSVGVRSVDDIGLRSSLVSITATTATDTIPPTIPTGLTSPSQTAATIALTWTASTDANGISGYAIYRGGVQVAVTQGVATQFTNSGLAAATSYTFAVLAIDSKGNRSALSSPVTVATSGDTTPPTVPSPPVATNVAYTSVTMAWAPASDNVAVTSYSVYKDGTLAGSTPGTTFTISSLLPGTAASYTVSARDAAGNTSALSGSTNIPTLGDTQAPTTPTNLLVSGRTATSLTLTWLASSDGTGSGVVSYDVLRGAAVVANVATTSFTDAGLTTGQSYTYTVVARDRASNLSSASLPLIAQAVTDVSAPTVPTSVVLVSKTATTAAISWTASTDPVGVTGYDVRRNNVVVARLSGTNFTDIGLLPASANSYAIAAYNAKGNRSAASTPLAVTTLGDVEPPTAPWSLVASLVTASTVTLTWQAAHDDTGIARYDIMRDGSVVASTSQTSAVMSGLYASTTYSFTVKAIDLANKSSDLSNAVLVTTSNDTQAPPVPWRPTVTAVGPTSVSLTWLAVIDQVAMGTYSVVRNGVTVGNTASTTYVDSGLSPGATYSYTLRATDRAGNSSSPSAVTTVTTTIDLQAPLAPTNLAWTTKTDHSVTLTWSAAQDGTGGSGVTQYQILRGGVQVGQVSGTTVTDEGLAADATYTYSLTARDAAGNTSPPSLAMQVKTNLDETSPTVPANVTTTQQTTSSVVISWSASTDNVAVVRYEIQRDGNLIASTSSLTYSDNPGTSLPSYAYSIRAVDARGNASAWSTLVTGAIPIAVASVLAEAAAFDSAKWTSDATYRQNYLQGSDPGRIWHSAAGSSTTPKLVVNGSRAFRRQPLQTTPTDLSLTGAASAPITLVCLGDGYFVSNGRNVITVLTDASGVAHVGFLPSTSGRHSILAASPLAVGQVRIVVEAP